MSEKTYKKINIEPFYVGSANASISGDGVLQATAVLEDVVVINRLTNQIIHTIQGDGTDVTTLRISNDGKKLAIVSLSQQLKLFDIIKGEFYKAYKLSAAAYISACDQTSSLFSFGLTDGSVVVWDIEGSFITHNFKGHGSTISALSFFGNLNSKNWKVSSGDIMGTVKVWDLVKRKCVFTSKEHSAAVRGVNFDKTGDLFISGGRDNLLMLYNTKSWKEIKSIPLEATVESTGFIEIEGETYIYTGGEGCILYVWDFKSESLFAKSKKPLETSEELSITEVIQLNDNVKKLIAVYSDQSILDLDFSVDLDETNHIVPCSRIMAGNHGTIADLKYVGPNRSLLALATNSPSLRVVDLYNKPLDMEICEGHTDLLNMLDSTVDGIWLATASKDNTARLWKFNQRSEKFNCVAVFEGHASSVTAVGLPRTPITEDEQPKFLITASEDLTIKKWSIPKITNDSKLPIIIKNSDYTRKAHDKMIHAIDISPNNDFLATASHDKTSKIWDLQGGETLHILRGHKRAVYDIAFCHYDRLIVTASGDQTARVWNLEDGSCTRSYEGSSNAVQRVAFLSKNQYIVGAGADGLIKIWEVFSGECVNTLDNHDNRIWALTVKDNGDEFISADSDGAISIWQDNTDEANAEKELAKKMEIEKDQDLRNCIREGDWVNAFMLALELNHPMRLYNVIKECISKNDDPKSVIGSFELEDLIGKLEDDKILLLFKRIRDWNTNARLFEVAQKVIRVILDKCNLDMLYQIKGIMQYIDAIVPYSERHFNRFDNLVEQSYILDYVSKKMDDLST
ncbi:U3 small nucleolar RNA-associated protein 13 [Pichia californica]|uniref:U3 small nucleolar RNA-associated protein 13 n=1 Tax=Pichia californica TaxID=460514 RepID=A0A9P7BE72_9ASCO|nr:U3 small nucleolar RNA-associated protein 13 [[Candida] californica]